MQTQLKIRKLDQSAVTPAYAHATDSGLDLFAMEAVHIPAGETRLISTGIAIELPLGTEAQIRPRSGLALKRQITVLNAPSTIDENYRGEIGIILINHGKDTFSVTKGMKIAQMVIAPVLHVEVQEVDKLSETDRGSNGFGSTGY